MVISEAEGGDLRTNQSGDFRTKISISWACWSQKSISLTALNNVNVSYDVIITALHNVNVSITDLERWGPLSPPLLFRSWPLWWRPGCETPSGNHDAPTVLRSPHLDQWEASIQVRWPVLTNKRPGCETPSGNRDSPQVFETAAKYSQTHSLLGRCLWKKMGSWGPL